MASPFSPFASIAARLVQAGASAGSGPLSQLLKGSAQLATDAANLSSVTVFCAVVNHLLDQHRSAKSRLKVEAGKTVAISVAPFLMVLRVNDQGYFQPSRAAQGVEVPEDTRISMEWSDLVGAVSARGQLGRKAQLSGDLDFAQVVASVLSDLQWDPEHDLARVVGDAQAVWIMNSLSALGTSLQDVVTRFKSNLREYVVHEKSMAPTASEMDAFRQDVESLRDELARLDKRLQRIEPNDNRGQSA